MIRLRQLVLATALWLAILAYLSIPVQMPTMSRSSDAEATTITQRDAAVVQAALDGFLRLEANRELGQSSTAGVEKLDVLNQTLRFCDLAGDANPLGCLRKWPGQKVPTVAAGISDWGKRRMLREFWERNQQSRLLRSTLGGVATTCGQRSAQNRDERSIAVAHGTRRPHRRYHTVVLG